jgi:hypothetical protein
VSVRVEFADAEPNGLASIVGGLIEANLERDPDRVAKLRRSDVGIVATDADVSLTVRMVPGRIAISNGLVPPLHLCVRATSETLLALTAVPLRFGLPDALTPQGRSVVRDLVSRRLRVEGLLRSPRRLASFTSLLSID